MHLLFPFFIRILLLINIVRLHHLYLEGYFMNRFLPLLLVLLSTFSATAQNSKNKIALMEGTRYMVAFPQVWASPSEKPLPQPMQLYISSKVKAKVRVQTPSSINDNARIDRTFTIQPNEVLKFPVPTSYMNGVSATGPESQTKRGYGIFVSSDKPISVSTYQAWMGNGELARHLPIEAWGKNYYTMNFYQDRYGTSGQYKNRPGQILLVASKDNTIVTYTPTWTTEGGSDNPSSPTGVTQTITLEKGETYLIKAKIDENYNKEWITDLSGTFISSNKPLGVISGHTKVAIMRYPDVLPPTGMFAAEAHFVRNNVHDAMLPVEMSGTKFVTVPCQYTPTRVVGQGSAEFGIDDDRGDVVRIVATADNTKVLSMRQDGSGLKAERTLRKGESFLATSLEVATYWETDKPVLMAHYGKSYAKILPPVLMGRKGIEQTQGHPTVESGMPMMQYVPPVNRWASYGVFSAPEGMDNFLNVVFRTEQVGQIKIDGRSLTSAFGGSTRPLKGTPYSYIRTPIGAGNHFIESAHDSIRWVAWTYGSLDGLQQGRAYGTPIAIDLAVPCEDSLDIIAAEVCGDIYGQVRLLPENSTCAQLFWFTLEDEDNYVLEANMDELTDAKVFPFLLRVVDKKKPAYAKVKVVTRSGNWIEKEYRYDGVDFVFDPTDVNFGTQPFKQQICTTVTVTNKQKTNVKLDSLKFGNVAFSVKPTSIQLGPNESKSIEICGVINQSGRITDTLVGTVNCVEFKLLPVEIRGADPVFYASDQNWGIIPKNDKQTKQIELLNSGKAEIIVTDFQPRGNAFFTNATLLKSLPLTLQPGQRFTYDIDYSPNGQTGVDHVLRINYTTNATKEKLYSDLNGKGSDAELSVSSFSWTERVIDGYQQAKGVQEYTGTIKIQNLGNTVSYIKDVSIGASRNVFRWTADQTLKDGMSPNETKTIAVYFSPMELSLRDAERKYPANIKVTYEVNGEVKEAYGDLEGTALQPMVYVTDQDWGSRTVGSTVSLPIEITNKSLTAFAPLTNNEGGTMDLTVDSLVIEGTEPFVWTTTGTKVITFNPPLSVASLTTFLVPVTFTPTQPGVYEATYRLYGNTLDTTVAKLRGEAPSQSVIQPLYLLTWIGTTTEDQVTGTVAYNTTLQFKEFRGGDYLLFAPAQGAPLTPFTVDASIPFTYNVEFTPDKVTRGGLKSGQNLNGRLPYQDRSFATQIVFEDGNGKELIGNINADGKYLETTLRIVADKDVPVDGIGKAAFFLEPKPESIDSGNVESSRLRILFEGGLLAPETIIPSNFPSALIIDETRSIGMLEIDLLTTPQVDGYLGMREFKGMLYSKNYSDITGLYYTIDKFGKTGSPYVVVNVIPDIMTVVPVCANGLRLVNVGKPYSIVVKNNGVEVTVGLDAPLTLTSVNELGQQEVIFSGYVKRGTYQFPIYSRGLQWVVGKQGDWMDAIGVFVH